MQIKENLPKRKPNRLEHHDYSSAGAYFITVCTKDRKPLFWQDNHQVIFVGEDTILPQKQIILSPYGKIVENAIESISVHYPGVEILNYVIMPNHLHMILFLPEFCTNGRIISSPTTNAKSVSTIIGQMKRIVSKNIGVPIWQRSFHDHIIRNEKDYCNIAEYIYNNPIYWKNDCFYNE